MFNGKLLKEKDKRIEDLQSQIKFLQLQIRMYQAYIVGPNVTPAQIELNQALSGDDGIFDFTKFTEAKEKENQAIIQEQNMLIMGEY